MVNEEKVDWGENRSGEKSWKRVIIYTCFGKVRSTQIMRNNA
jgi:hypothetical protein